MRTLLFSLLLLLGAAQSAVRPVVVHDTLRIGLRAPHVPTETPAAPEKPSSLAQHSQLTPQVPPPGDDKHPKASPASLSMVAHASGASGLLATDATFADVLPPFVRPLIPRAPPFAPRV